MLSLSRGGKQWGNQNRADWFSPSGCRVGLTGDHVYFEGQHITESCRELPAGLPVSPAVVAADGGGARCRRVEWHHNATSAGPGG